MTDEVLKFLPLILAIGGLIYKQLSINQTVNGLIKDVTDNEEKIKSVENDLHMAIKEQGTKANESMAKLTDAVSELVISTRIMASQLEDIKKQRA